MTHETTLYARWSQEMRRSPLYRAGERIGIAVSGGADSILLLDFMHQFAQEAGLKLAVVHFNHHLRAEESDADEALVAGDASRRGLELMRDEAAVERIAREKRRNLEAVARELRYRFFFSLVNQNRLDRVATAHTANDQAETVLLRLLRGAGARGMGGIFPVLDGIVVRPFLSLTRPEIERELASRRLAFRTDASNLDRRFTRNRIRLEFLPLIEKNFNPAIVPLLKNFADRARDEEAYLERMAAELARPWRLHEDENEKIPLRALSELPAAIERRVLRQMVASVSGSGRGLNALHLEALRRFAAEGQSGRVFELPNRIEARKEFQWLIIGPKPPAAGCGFCLPVSPPAELAVPQLGVKFSFKIAENPLSHDAEKTYNNRQGIGIDFEKLHGDLFLRNWRSGDRFRPEGSQKAHKLKELFLEHKIPAGQRRLWPVLLSGDEIIWVRGFPLASDSAASVSSKTLLTIEEAPLVEESSRAAAQRRGPGAAARFPRQGDAWRSRGYRQGCAGISRFRQDEDAFRSI